MYLKYVQPIITFKILYKKRLIMYEIIDINVILFPVINTHAIYLTQKVYEIIVKDWVMNEKYEL